MSAIIIHLKIKVKKKNKGLRIFTRFFNRKLKRREKKTCRLVLDCLYTSFDITPMLMNNLSNFFTSILPYLRCRFVSLM